MVSYSVCMNLEAQINTTKVRIVAQRQTCKTFAKQTLKIREWIEHFATLYNIAEMQNNARMKTVTSLLLMKWQNVLYNVLCDASCCYKSLDKTEIELRCAKTLMLQHINHCEESNCKLL